MSKNKKSRRKAAKKTIKIIQKTLRETISLQTIRQTLHDNHQRTFRFCVRPNEEVVVKAVPLSCLRRNKDHHKNPIHLPPNP